MTCSQPQHSKKNSRKQAIVVRALTLTASWLLFLSGVKDFITGTHRLIEGTSALFQAELVLLVAGLASVTFYIGWFSFRWVKSSAKHEHKQWMIFLLGLPVVLITLTLGLSEIAVFTDAALSNWYRIFLACSAFVAAGAILEFDDSIVGILRELRVNLSK